MPTAAPTGSSCSVKEGGSMRATLCQDSRSPWPNFFRGKR